MTSKSSAPPFKWEKHCACAGESLGFACTLTSIPTYCFSPTMQEPGCVFHNPNFEVVTIYIYIYIYVTGKEKGLGKETMWFGLSVLFGFLHGCRQMHRQTVVVPLHMHSGFLLKIRADDCDIII